VVIEEGRRKKEEGRRKKEELMKHKGTEAQRKKEEGRRNFSCPPSPYFPMSLLCHNDKAVTIMIRVQRESCC
jgi:hypothetical protein